MKIRGAIEIACDGAAAIGRWLADRHLSGADRCQNFVLACNHFKRSADAEWKVALAISAVLAVLVLILIVCLAFKG